MSLRWSLARSRGGRAINMPLLRSLKESKRGAVAINMPLLWSWPRVSPLLEAAQSCFSSRMLRKKLENSVCTPSVMQVTAGMTRRRLSG